MEQYVSVASCAKNKEACYQTNIKPLMEKIDKLDEKIDEVKIDIASLPERLIEKMDQRYATKETEENLKWLTRLVVGAVIMAVLGLVLVK